MKQFFLLAAVALTSMTASAQFGAQRGNPVVPSVKAEVEDFKPAVSNQENKQFPAVNSKRQVRAQIMAPNAKFVGLDIAGKIYEMTKDENGLWTPLGQWYRGSFCRPGFLAGEERATGFCERGVLLVNLYRKDAPLPCISASRVLHQSHQEIPCAVSAARYG